MPRAKSLHVALIFALASPAAAAPYNGPVIDAHNHWTPSRTVAKVLKLMEQHRVTATVLMARQYGDPKNKVDLPGTDQMTLELAQKYPGKFVPLVGMQLPMLTPVDWNKPNEGMERLYKLTAEKLASGRFHGIGEIIIRHYPYFNHPVSDGPNMDISKEPDTEHMRRLAEIAVQYDRPMVIHMEGEPALVASLDAFLARQPKLKLIWAHACGRIAPAIMESMLATHKNLYCDLATMTNTYQGYGYAVGRHYPEHKGWPSAYAWTFLIEENGEFFPEVKRVIERFADRFLGVGMDNAHMEINDASYASRMKRFRELLGTLAPDLAEKLAFRNATRVFRLKLSPAR
jgi:Tat protein secretion system quality control protein TatD with DNase activity